VREVPDDWADVQRWLERSCAGGLALVVDCILHTEGEGAASRWCRELIEKGRRGMDLRHRRLLDFVRRDRPKAPDVPF
jgi:hypothetical protein